MSCSEAIRMAAVYLPVSIGGVRYPKSRQTWQTHTETSLIGRG